MGGELVPRSYLRHVWGPKYGPNGEDKPVATSIPHWSSALQKRLRQEYTAAMNCANLDSNPDKAWLLGSEA